MLIAEIRDANGRCWARSCCAKRTLRPGQGYFGLAKIPGRPKAPAGQVQAVIIGNKAAAVHAGKDNRWCARRQRSRLLG